MPRITTFLLLFFVSAANLQAADKPNILWLFAEDTSPWMGCYGDKVNQGHTPHIDSLAERGIRFSRAFVPAPVCSACRSALMGGQNQIRFNAHEHRSSRGTAKLQLPPSIKLLPQLVKENGYFTFNLGKSDYNFVWDNKATYSLEEKNRANIPWDKLKASQPFFGQIQTAGGKNKTQNFPKQRKADPQEVTVPADYPQNDLYREVVAQHYDAIRKDDDFIGTVLAGLKESGLDDNTIIVYFGDHGANNLLRHKQMPTEGGLHVPFIISGSQKFIPAPSVRDDLVNMLDLSATTLKWAGVKIPKRYEGQDLFGDKVIPRGYVFAAKDRLDHTIDRVRTVRSDRFRYTRNYKTDRIFLQPQYRDKQPYTKNLRELYASGKLSPKLTEIYFGERPAEELYDVKKDPAQINNLINDPAFKEVVAEHREQLDDWIAKGDAGEGEESVEELAYQAKGHKWGAAVNPEYEVVRTDGDGDGLSDAWEKINGRDPSDGKLQFLFDCGGWQTEGWKGSKPMGNIAGRLGFLDFVLPNGKGTLVRSGLKLDAAKLSSSLAIKIRSSKKLTVQVSARQKGANEFTPLSYEAEAFSAGQIAQNKSFSEHQFLWPSNLLQGTIESLQIKFDGSDGAFVEIDSIQSK